MKNKFLEVKVFWSPIIKKEPFQGKVKAVSSKNSLGNFDILPSHANFISLIFGTLTLHFPKEKITYQFERGVLEVSEDKVRIFLGI